MTDWIDPAKVKEIRDLVLRLENLAYDFECYGQLCDDGCPLQVEISQQELCLADVMRMCKNRFEKLKFCPCCGLYKQDNK